jgi:AcrR family transcriptional regulator
MLCVMADDAHVLVLPRGRHRLTRAQVAASQRGRMLDAMAQVVAEQGYAHTTVAAVVARSGVSSKAFYEQFSDKEDCFLAAYDTGTDVLLHAMRAAFESAPADPLIRFDRALGAYLHLLATETAFARTFLIEVYAAGPQALERRFAVQRLFVDFVVESLPDRVERFACEALVGAVSSLVTRPVASHRYEDLAALRVPITELVRQCLSAAQPVTGSARQLGA